MKIVMIYADSPREWNCSQWRSLTPSDAINRSEEHTCKLIHVTGFMDYLNPVIQELIGPVDIIVFQRNLVEQQVFDAIRYWQGMGKPVAVDLDDAYHVLPWSNPAHKFWIERGDTVNLQKLEYGLSISDGLIAPNRLLLSDWSYATRGYYLANYSEEKWWKDLPSREELKAKRGLQDKVIIGWGGSVSHYDGWHGAGIMRAAQKIANRYENAVFMVCGNDSRIYDHLDVPVDQKIIQPGVPPHDWPKVVKTFDIGIAPLFGPYDQRRSWIKGLEYLLAGVPWIATRGEPYRDLSSLGTLINNGENDWYGTMARMIDDLPNQQAIAETRIAVAQQWHANNQVDTMVGVFQQIINDFNQSRGATLLPGVAHIRGEGIPAPPIEVTEQIAERIVENV